MRKLPLLLLLLPAAVFAQVDFSSDTCSTTATSGEFVEWACANVTPAPPPEPEPDSGCFDGCSLSGEIYSCSWRNRQDAECFVGYTERFSSWRWLYEPIVVLPPDPEPPPPEPDPVFDWAAVGCQPYLTGYYCATQIAAPDGWNGYTVTGTYNGQSVNGFGYWQDAPPVIDGLTITPVGSAPPPPDPDPTPPPPDPIPSGDYRGIPDPSNALGFDVYADYTPDQVITGTHSGNFSISGTGTANDPYFVDATAATFNVGTGSVTVTGSYVVLNGGKINATGESSFNARASNSVYRNLDIGGNNSDWGHGATIFPASNTVFINVKVHDYGVINTTQEQDQHGWKIQANSVWILESEGYRLSGDGVQCGDASRGRCDNVYIGGGSFHNNRENGVDVKDSRNVVVSGVSLYGFAGTSSDPGAAIVVHDDAYDARFLDNIISNARIGVVTSGVSGHEIDGNSIQATFRGIECRNTQNVKITNNYISAPTPIERQSNCNGIIQ